MSGDNLSVTTVSDSGLKHTENVTEKPKEKKKVFKFVHTFGYHRKPKPASIPKRIKIASKNRFIECAEQLEFNFTSYFMENADDLWVDNEHDDYIGLMTRVEKDKKLESSIITLPKDNDTLTKSNQLETKTVENEKNIDDIIRIKPRNFPILDVSKGVEQTLNLNINHNHNNIDDSSDVIGDPNEVNIFEQMIEEEFSNSFDNIPPSNSLTDITEENFEKYVYEMIPWEKEVIAFENNNESNMIDILNAGWIPSNEIRTWKDFITNEFQSNTLEHETLLLLLNVLASLKMASDHPDGSFNTKDWYNLLINSFGNNYETDIYSLPTYITRHLISIQNPSYSRHISVASNVRDYMNISNDKFYICGKKTNEEDIFDESTLTIKHAYPTEIIHRTLIPIYLDCVAARQFHRPIMASLTYGPLSKPGYRLVRNLQSHIKKKSKEMQKKRKLYGYTDISFMQTLDDITSTDGHIILLEYSEEFPPLLCQNGMNSILIQFCRLPDDNNPTVSAATNSNYNRHYPDVATIKQNISVQQISNRSYVNMNAPPSRTMIEVAANNSNLANSHEGNEGDNHNIQHSSIVNDKATELGTTNKSVIVENRPKFGEYGKPMYINKTSPFLGTLKSNQILLALENNLYRAPLYRHDIPKTDFLVIRNSGGYFIREFQSIFVVGQQIPKRVIPMPGSKASTKYNRDLLQVYIYRHFHRSKELPPRLKTDEIRRLFKHNSENAIRKRLKYCSDYKRNSSIPGEVGSWHLRENFLLPSLDEMIKICRPEDACVYFSMIAAERRLKDLGYDKKMYSLCENGDDDGLDALGMDDEILSAPWNTSRAYLDAIRGKCVLSVQDGPADPTGKGLAFSYTKADSKYESNPKDTFLNNKTTSMNQTDLRKINMKVAKKYLISFGMNPKKVDEMSRWEVVDALKNHVQDEKNLPAMFHKYTRTTKILTPQALQSFKKLCQQQFENQNKLLNSSNIATSLKITSNIMDSDTENIDNEQLGKDLEGFLNDIQIYDSSDASNDEVGEELNNASDTTSVLSMKPENNTNISKLSKNTPSKLVIKRLFNDNGKVYERTEIITNPRVINAYRKTVRKNAILEKKIQIMSKPRKKYSRISTSNISLPNSNNHRNIRTQSIGQMSSLNHEGPSSDSHSIASLGRNLSQKTNSPIISTKLKFSFDEPKKIDHVKIEGTKLYIDKTLFESSKDKKRNSVLLKLSKDYPNDGGRKRKLSDTYDYYMYKPFKSHGRRRTNPQVSLNVIFESIVNELKKMNDSWPFHQPVNSKLVNDYYTIVKEPMDLQTLKDLILKHDFSNRKEFIDKVKLIEKNCILYNGIGSSLTTVSKKIVDTCQSMINERDEEIFALEKDINPLLDEDAQIPLSWIFENIIVKVRGMDEAYPFLQPVSSKLFPNYRDYVTTPMDLNQIKNNCHTHKYSNVDSFMYDVRLIYDNSVKFNGEDHNVTKLANKVIQCVEEELLNMNEHIQNLQDEITNQPAQLKKFYEESRRNEKSLHNKKPKNNLTHNLKNKISSHVGEYDILKDLEMSDDDD